MPSSSVTRTLIIPGGLVNLIWTLRKLNGRVKDPVQRLSGKTVQLFIPDLSVWEGAQQVLAGPTSEFRPDFAVQAQRYEDGLIYEDGDFRVFALHNAHLGVRGEGESWQSYSFRIEAAGRSIVYSGDVKGIQELAPFLACCDVLLMETGHHRVEDICNYLRNSDHRVGQLVFTHHGRAILEDPDGEAQKARAMLGSDVIIADDGMKLEL